ncbi:universal stress protein [Chitinophaga sp. 212800010-3]|uniref:universal stress protein n=1 Tax=unclassified Chitinophaga TaxID=2619133 RepID=UPI002DE3B451|nr:Universal stress protein [Chitinophaga sp. 212800010-3]
MTRIIAAIDPLNFSESQIAGFKYFEGLADSDLSIVCLDNLTAEVVPQYGRTEAYAYSDERIIAETRAALEWERKKNIARVKEICGNVHLKAEIREARGFPEYETILDSRFADLLLISNGTSFAVLQDSNPTVFVKEVLAKAECPVLVMPDVLGTIREIVFSYNGTFSSMYAIKQFTQLFPGFSHLPVEVVYVAEKGEPAIPWKDKLKEYLEQHYQHIEYIVLNGEPATEFLALLHRRTDCVVTYGAYGRSAVSRFFHRSDAESVLRTTNIPVFITHP